MKRCHTSNSSRPSLVVFSLQPNLNTTSQRAAALNFLYLFFSSYLPVTWHWNASLCFETNEFCSKSHDSHEQQVYTILNGKCCVYASSTGFRKSCETSGQMYYTSFINVGLNHVWERATQLLAWVGLCSWVLLSAGHVDMDSATGSSARVHHSQMFHSLTLLHVLVAEQYRTSPYHPLQLPILSIGPQFLPPAPQPMPPWRGL